MEIDYYIGYNNESTSEVKSKILIGAKLDYKYHNIRNLAGYVPVLGIFTGLTRIEQAIFVPMQNDIRIYMVVRGIFEILGAGSLFLIPDLAVTAWRFRPCRHEAAA